MLAAAIFTDVKRASMPWSFVALELALAKIGIAETPIERVPAGRYLCQGPASGLAGPEPAASLDLCARLHIGATDPHEALIEKRG